MPEDTFSNTSGFGLIPADDEELVSADAQLAAAESSLSDDPFISTPTQAPPVPMGRSWAWDRERERYVRAGSAPIEVRGYASLREWIYNAISTAQGVHPIFSDEFGIEDPDDWIGLADPTDAIATFEPRFREAVLQHDRIEDIDDMTIDYDPSTGIITIPDIVIITDQSDAVALTDIELAPNF